MKIDAEVLMRLAEETGRKLCAERYDEILSLEDLEALVRKCQETPARVIPAEELPATGTGWYELRIDEADLEEGMTFEDGLMETAWADWHGVIMDGKTDSYGIMRPDKEYNRIWRVWDRKPTPEERKAVKWDD